MELAHRISLAFALLATALSAPQASAQTPPLVVYDNELKDGWQNWSWAKVETLGSTGVLRPYKVQGGAWTALVLHHDTFATAQYTKVTFYINGGPDGGQRLMVKATAEGKPIDSNYIIEPKPKTWALVEVTLKDLSAEDRSIDGLMLQADGSPYKPYYITKIQFE